MTHAALIDENVLIGRKPTLVSADVVDEAILLDVDSGYFFQLNKTAARIWGLVETPRPLSALYAELEQAYDVDAATCRSDAAAFIADLLDRELLVIETPA